MAMVSMEVVMIGVMMVVVIGGVVVVVGLWG